MKAPRFSLPSSPTRKKKSTGWVQVNMAEWEVEQMRALAECAGAEFRTLLRSALFHYWRDLEKEIGLKARVALDLSREQRRAMGREQRAFRNAIGYYMGGSEN
ncbi:MAG TPA: hypothetical protein VFC44_06935 [Candidatus Saccharimonadales bacterium]|nr:hypothetical protein [Candidatus Saccharimonadales bacterium]